MASLATAARPILASATDIDAGTAPPAADDILVKLEDDASVHVVAPSDLRVGAAPLLVWPPLVWPLLVWPMQPSQRLVRNSARFNQILLLRLAPDPGGEFAAFSAICTHASCVVTEWNAGSSQLVCPRHGSVYAARQDGAVVGGPAPRSLPSLPVKLADGVLVASGFGGRVDGDTSRTM